MKAVKQGICTELAMVLTSQRSMFFLKMLILAVLMVCWRHVFADDGGDVLKGTAESAKKTVEGTGMFYFMLGEACVAIFLYYKTRSPVVFVGFPLLLIFTGIAFSVADKYLS